MQLVLDLDDLVALPDASQAEVMLFRHTEFLDVIEDPIVAVFVFLLLVSFNELLLLLLLTVNYLLVIC